MQMNQKKFFSFWGGGVFLSSLLAAFMQGEIGQMVAGVLYSLLFFIGYYGIIYWSLYQCKFSWKEVFQSGRDIFAVFSISVLSMFFIVKEIHLSKVVYSWDSYAVWYPAVVLSRDFFQEPLKSLATIYYSINTVDYNSFLGLLFALPLHIFGEGFIVYILSGWILFLLPAALLFSVAIRYLMKKTMEAEIPISLLFSLFLLLPAIYVPIFWGYMYLCVLLPGCVILILFLHMSWEKVEYDKLTNMVLLFIILILQNRTFAYLIFGYVMASFFYFLLETVKSKQADKKFFANLILGYVYIAGVFIAVLRFFFEGFWKRTFFTDYHSAYSAYNFNLTFLQKIYYTTEYFGIIIFLLLLGSMIMAVFQKSIRKYMFMMFVWLIVPICLLNSVLRMNYHQMYVILIPLLVILSIPLGVIWRKNRSLGQKNVLSVCFICVLTINCFYVFFDTTPIHAHFFPDIRQQLSLGFQYHPIVLEDISELQMVAKDLNHRTQGTGDKIYMLSSSITLNEDVLNKLYFPNVLNTVSALQGSSHVDLRDGFNPQFFSSEYILVADPRQYCLPPNSQRVIGLLAEMMLTDTPIAKKFECVEVYKLHPAGKSAADSSEKDQEIRLYLYKKKQPISRDDIEYVQTLFAQYYKAYPQLFDDRFEESKRII